MSSHGYTEDDLVKQPALDLLRELGWDTVDAYGEFGRAGGDGRSALGRETESEVVLVARLRPALERLNRDAGETAVEQAIEELTRDRSRMSSAAANREIYGLLKDGVRVTVPAPRRGRRHGRTDPGHRLERSGEERLPALLGVLGGGRDVPTPGRSGRPSSTVYRCCSAK